MSELSATLEQQYSMRFSENQKDRYAVWKVLIKHYFQALVPEDGTLLDLGAGWGEFVNQIQARKKYAMDLNPSTQEKLDSSVSLLLQDCSQIWPLDENSLDVIFTSNFFEHLPDKSSLDRTLTEAFRCLKPGGRIICMGPNIKFLPGAYWDFWDHYIAITELSLSEALGLQRFEVILCKDRFLPYTMVGKKKPPDVLIALYLRLPLAWKFKGQQFLVVAQKPV